MLDPSEIYEIDTQTADELDRIPGPHPMVHAVRGFVDAGNAGQLTTEHLLRTGDPQRLVTFDVDQLLDYRSRRPVMTFDVSSWSSYADPILAIDLLRDARAEPFLLLHGVEPDVQWERYVAAVRQLVERFDVSQLVGVHGIPMGVPHTRPLTVTAHGTRPELVAQHQNWFGSVQVPASVSALMEFRLGQDGHDALGFAVHVPHYLTQSSYPQAAAAALTHVERATGLDLRVTGLDPAIREAESEIARQIAESDEVGAIVHAMEEQYDSFARAAGQGLLADDAQLPTADELGEEFERFLAQQRGGEASL